jgi:nucleoside-diphosphate-sugar epimerase
LQILVTGATGFVGGAVARRLTSRGHAVRALVRSPERAQALANLGIALHPGDITDKASLRAPMTGVDAVFHVAGWYHVGVPDADAYRVNVEGTRHVLETMAEVGIARGVYTSTVAIYSDTHGRVVDETYRFEGRHLSRYDETKAEAHRVAEAFAAQGLPIVIVQPGAVYGPGDTSALGGLWRRFLARSLPPLPTRTAFCWTHVEDVAEGHVLAFERGRPGRSYLFCGPAYTLVETMHLASRLTGAAPPRVWLPPWVLRAATIPMALVGRFVRLPPEFTAEGLRVMAGVTYLGTSARARRELGWRARPFEDGLIETLRFERARAQGETT